MTETDNDGAIQRFLFDSVRHALGQTDDKQPEFGGASRNSWPHFNWDQSETVFEQD